MYHSLPYMYMYCTRTIAHLDSACVSLLMDGDLPSTELLLVLLELLVLSLRLRSVGGVAPANSCCCEERGGGGAVDCSPVATGWATAPVVTLGEAFADCPVDSPFEAA